jgi:lipid-A-disaccharide synthase
MTETRPLKLAIVAGEESGDLLGADLVSALAALTGREIELFGVGGRHLQALGLNSLFDPADISIVGVSAVVRDLPRIVHRIGRTARAIAAYEPDCLVTIDVPAFSLRVAQKLRAARPTVPVVHYVCPSVWAWRPERAPKMRAYVDKVLCLLPFEPGELQRLGGPPGIFVGHRLARDPQILAAAERQRERAGARRADGVTTLLVLPGSRNGEVKTLLPPFGEAVSILRERGNGLRLLLPTVPHVSDAVRQLTENWPERPEIILDPARKWEAFGDADVALAASGTVSLELALARVPLVSCYKADPLMRLLRGMIRIWTASLPNLIADRPVVPEYYNEFVRPGMLARKIEQLAAVSLERAAQLEGFDDIAAALSTPKPSGEIAAEIVLREIRRKAKK